MRRELDDRPQVVAALAFAIGLTVPYVPWHVVFAIGLLALSRTVRSALVIAIAVPLGFWFSPPHIQLLDKPIFVTGVGHIVSVPEDNGRFVLNTEGYRLYAMVPPGLDLSLGDEVSVHGVASPWVIPDFGSEIDGLIGMISLDARQIQLKQRGPWVARIADAWRRDFRRFTKETLGDRDGGFVDALCFNDTFELAPEDKQAMKTTGTVHIVSASGFHVFVFATILSYLFSLLPIPYRGQLLALGLLLGLYCLAAGLQPPIVRSVLMAMAWRSSFLFRREPDFLSALGGSALVILLWMPFSLWSPGFQLSFITVAGLVLFTPRGGGLCREAWNGSVVAMVASTPLLAYHFGYVPLLTVPANLAILLPVSAIIGISLFAHPLHFALPMVWIVQPYVDLTRWLILKFAEPSWSVFSIPEFSPYFLVVWYVAILMLWRPQIVRA